MKLKKIRTIPKIPSIVKGADIPEGIQELWLQEAKEKEALKKQHRHDFYIATYGIIGGIISGAVSSLIVLWLQGLL